VEEALFVELWEGATSESAGSEAWLMSYLTVLIHLRLSFTAQQICQVGSTKKGAHIL
jgi:hypothetical protein